MLVTVAVLGIVLAAVMPAMITISRSVAGSGQRLGDLGQARVAMDAVSRSLRTAVRIPTSTSPFTLTDVDEVQFYANNGPNVQAGPSLVRLVVDDQGQLVERTTPPTPSGGSFTYNPAQERARVLTGNIADPSLFRYVCGAAVCPAGFDRAAVTAVDISISVLSPGNLGVPASQLQNRVRVINAVPPTQ
jgi:type II secretory pathway pseudopilin PulG